ncbi:MAG: hypothetical protein QM755_23715 [Luteolibacter sp.]
MSYEFSRNQRDAAFSTTKANAAAGANSTAFDLEQLTGGDIENVVVELVLPAEAGLSDSKALTYTFKDSADNSSFAAVEPAVAYSYTGTGGTGFPAKTLRFRLPVGCRRYIRVEQTATSTPGTLAASFAVNLLF